MKCSFCGKEMADIRFHLDFNVSGERRTLNGNWEDVPNFGFDKKEIICKKCLDNVLDSLSIEKR